MAVLPWPRSEPPREDGVFFQVPGRKAILLTRGQAEEIASGESSLPMPGRRSVRVGMAEITYKLDRDGTQRALGGLAQKGGRVRVTERPVGVMIDVPVVKQAYRSNSETAALQMLLASRGVDHDQRELQRLLRRDGPPEPRRRGDGAIVWGNPERGFVGRADEGGAAVGFGVYLPPLSALARRWVEPVNLSGRSPRLIFAQLLRGHAVLTWIGPAAGPYRSWVGPRGERVTVNWGEHAVLLVGLAGSRILLNDPQTGKRQNWSRQQFKRHWGLLGRRALSA
ncbi:MAG: C39 family peptidase [Solirubrobacterales bacterium]